MNATEILLVDDDPRILESFGRRLRRQGYRVKTAMNGIEALETLKNSEPDIIISDMRMPQMDGVELMKKIPVKDGAPPGRIIFTAFDDGEAMEMAKLGEGGVFRVEKDRWGTDLQPAIARALELRKITLELIKNAKEKLRQEKKLAELKAVQELNKLQNVFMASINHEFRTPLTGIIGFAQTMLLMLERGNLTPDKITKYLKHVLDSADRLVKLLYDVTEILLIAKGVHLDIQEIALHHIIKELQSEMLEKAAAKNLVFEINLPENLQRVKADRRRLAQVLRNLIENAVKFTNEGRVVVEAVSGAEGVTVSVSDTGIGIKEEEVKYIFGRFTKVDNSGFRPGTGLGLYISENLVKLMGGEIWLDSKAGKGSTFHFTLPNAEAVSAAKPEFAIKRVRI